MKLCGNNQGCVFNSVGSYCSDCINNISKISCIQTPFSGQREQKLFSVSVNSTIQMFSSYDPGWGINTPRAWCSKEYRLRVQSETRYSTGSPLLYTGAWSNWTVSVPLDYIDPIVQVYSSSFPLYCSPQVTVIWFEEPKKN